MTRNKVINDLLAMPELKIIIMFSGGKDSIALYLYLRFILGIPNDRFELWHQEVDGNSTNLFDWKCTPSYCLAFAREFGVPLHFQYRKGGILREIYRTEEPLQDVVYKHQGTTIVLQSNQKAINTRRKFPAVTADIKTRWCSGVAKINVSRRVINHRFKKGLYLVCTGERRQESTARSKYKVIEKHNSCSNSRIVYQWRPILDMKEEEVWRLFERFKIQPHPCYELGWNRCSCQICIFGSENVWASINEISPEKIAAIDYIEKDIGFTLYHKYITVESRHEIPDNYISFKEVNIGRGKNKKRGYFATIPVSIREKVSSGNSFIKKENLLRWKDEANGEFVSPIIVDEWNLPQGAFGKESSGSL